MNRNDNTTTKLNGCGKMAWLLKACATPSEDQSLIPRTHVSWLTTAHNSSSRGSNAFGHHSHRYPCAHYLHQTHTYKVKQDKYQKRNKVF